MERRGFLALLLAPMVAPLCQKPDTITLMIDDRIICELVYRKSRGVFVRGPSRVLMGEAGADVSCPVSTLPEGFEAVAARKRAPHGG